MNKNNELIALKPLIQYGRMDFSQIDTSPGAVSWAAPPQPVEDYTQWLRLQFKHHHAVAQYFLLCARRLLLKKTPVEITGSYKDELRAAMNSLVKL
ncbi:MAG TPA: hypothetical protein ENJ08_14745 [Gammaproteobacteria bacterium]|nr:hypothetical protein [Gammaproteobacteria bacterium]